MAQVMPLPGVASPKMLTNRISPSGLKQAPANSEPPEMFTGELEPLAFARQADQAIDVVDARRERVRVVVCAAGVVLAEQHRAARRHAQVVGRIEHAARRRLEAQHQRSAAGEARDVLPQLAARSQSPRANRSSRRSDPAPTPLSPFQTISRKFINISSSIHKPWLIFCV